MQIISSSHVPKSRRPIVPVDVPNIRDSFPFTISNVSCEERMHKAIDIRASAYGRHVPELGIRFRQIEALDREEGVTVLLAESKPDGSPVGSVRIQTNQNRQLMIEQAATLPFPENARLAESTRLAVCQQGIGRVVKLALFRATYQFCLLTGVDYLVIGARSPLDRQYRGFLFEEVFPGLGPIPLTYANNIPHHILFLDIRSAASRWKKAEHPMHEFLTEPDHPDIMLMHIVEPIATTH